MILGNIRTLTKLDAESKPHYWITVMATDHGVAPLSSRLEVFLSVTNVNDNVPLTREPVYYPRISENSPANTPVIQLTASDPDSLVITYRITSGNPESCFSIDSHSGLITTTGRKLDRENQAEHILEVAISDDGVPSLSSTTRVVVMVDDENDNSPHFQQNLYLFHIPETIHQESALTQYQGGSSEIDIGSESILANGTWESFPEYDSGERLFRVIAVDQDIGENGALLYEIMEGGRGGKGRFGINPKTGVIYSQHSFRAGQEYDLFVRATDHGFPNRSSISKVSVQVVPLPDESPHPPVVKNPNQKVDVHESDEVGFLVLLVQSEDEDGDALWYKIVDGDPNSEFLVIADKGSILLARQLNWETKNFYNLTISITDGIHTVYTQVYVNVVDINEHRPTFSKPLYTANVSESVTVGTEIIKLSASDLDQDSKVVFSLHSAQSSSSLHHFAVDYLTGAISVIQPLDRETISEHVMTVMVKDQGTPAKKNFARVVVTVHDANDHTPEFSVSLIQGRVFETSPIGITVLTLNAVDKDHGENAEIVYTLSSGNVGNAFTLDPVDGTLHVARELDIGSMTEYMLIVKASDKGSPPLSSTIPVHIMVVMADNAPPRFTRREVAAELYENEPAGTSVKHLDARSTSSLHFEILLGNVDNAFAINPTTGMIYTNNALDYEKIGVYNLTVTATNMAGAKALCHVVVHVLDRNDNAPYFHQAEYRGWINEDATIGSLIFANQTSHLVISASDKDSELNSILQFEIVEPGPRRMFHIDSTTGAVRTIIMVDYEVMPLIIFHVRVTDLGKPRLSSTSLAKVIINIADVNDCGPIFTQASYNASVLIPTYPNIAIIELNATDRDSANLTRLTYSISSGNSENIYSLESGTGIIRVRDPVKGARSSSHKLLVSVSDGKFTDEATVNVRWDRSIDSGLVFQRQMYHGSVLENTTKPITVAVVTVVGNHLNEHLIFTVLNPSPLFEIGITSGALRTTGLRFDREQQEYYQLIIQAKSIESNDRDIRVAHVPVNITVLDINDNCPMFVNLPYYAVVSVDAHKGDVITKVHAVDLDKGENGEVRYELIRGHGELFKVCRKTGEISLKQALEGHNREYQLIIGAYDGGSTPCSTEVTVNVKVMDRSMPIFDKQFYSVSTPENIELHTPLSISIQAESPLGRKLIYSIANGNDFDEFAVDFNTASDSNNGPCGLYTVDELDYEKKKEYDLTVRATDSISGVYADVLVSVLITDVNDCAPAFPSDSYNVSVSEASPFGTILLKVTAYDNDTGANGEVRYSLDKSDTSVADFFYIDTEDGSIFLKRSLDHETQTLHHIIVIATDNGVPSLSNTVHVWVEVLDMNDNPPKLEQSVYTWLSEEASRGQVVTIVSASDPDAIDHNRLSYSIVGGNQQQTFSMDKDTGIISLTNLHKLVETRAHILNVSVSDGVYTSFTKVTIEMIAANQHSPEFNKHLYESRILENLPPGAIVAKVAATDKDSDYFGTVTYFIQSSLMNEKFTINNMTGEIRTKISFDREEQKVYEIPVVAVDGGGKLGFTSVRAWVSDVNDNAPTFLLPEYKACIHSNLTVNSGFLKMKAIDKDEDANALIEYSIYEREASGVRDIFTINKNTGALSLQRSALPYENQVFQFFVRATDHGSPRLHSEAPVDVYIMSPNDVPPLFERTDDKFFITESATPGTVVTRVKLVSEMPVKYKLLSGTNQFNIDSSGQITLIGQLDRESESSHVIGVLAHTESSPPLTAVAEISLQVLDYNDNKPYFDSDHYDVYIAENLKEGSLILKVHAFDADEGSNGEVLYMITGPGTEVFAIDAHTGWISTLILLDREITSSYTLTVVATDSGTPSNSNGVTVNIYLLDYNDNPPRFVQDVYTAAVNEDAIPGTVVVQVAITDLDSEATNVEYHIIRGDPHTQFDVRVTGEVYVARPVDRESIDHYHLSLFATDGKHVALTTLSIDILDANDQQPFCLKYRYKESVSEGVPPGTHILNVRAADLDLDSKLRFYLTGNGSETFILDRSSGELKTAKPLDREKLSEYSLSAHVQDKEHPEWECTSLIEISVLDLNDNPPVFPSANLTSSVLEDVAVGSLITKIHASDDDIGINRKIRYFLLDSADGHFNIAPDSGIVTLAKPLDRETKAFFNLTVKAVDLGVPQLWSVATLTVVVLDVNDNPPEFVSRSYHTTIPESAAIDTEVARVMATSLDTGMNAEIQYAIVGGNEHGKFVIDHLSGVVSIAQPLDYERAHEYLITIQAMDFGTPPLSNQATVNITVLDSNDNAPTFSKLSYSSRISEDCGIGDVVEQVSATDQDTDLNGIIRYSIERGDKHKQFSIDPNSGKVTVAEPLDREMIPNYTLQIRATDSGIPSLSSFVMLNIEVKDVNDNPPLFTQTNYTVIVQEDKRPGWPVVQLLVTDNDIAPNTGPFVFDLLAGKSRPPFRIETDGTIRTAALLSHKRESSYSLHVRVFDNGSPTLYSDTWVIVKVIEESQYPPIVTPLDIWIGSYQERWLGGEIGRIHATDQDQYDIMNYSIVNNPTLNPLFSLEPRQGVLTSSSGLDTGHYSLNVSVSDGKFTSYTTVRVVVEALWDEMLQHSYSIRVPDISPLNFILTQKKRLLKDLRLALMTDVGLISVQDTGNGDTDVLLHIKGGIDAEALNAGLQAINLPVLQLDCHCLNGAICRQRISLDSERIITIASDFVAFVAPGHTHDLYCACDLGFTGEHCETILPATQCECPPTQTCIPQPAPPGFVCAPPSPASPLCSPNHTCPPPQSPATTSPFYYNITWQYLIIGGVVASLVLLIMCCICITCRCCRNKSPRLHENDKTNSVLNPDVKRSSKLSNLEVTQCTPRPASYTSGSNNDVYNGPLNNLDTVRSYGSAGDELENAHPDYVKNLNRNANSPAHKINNDIKRISETTNRGPRRTLSCVEDDARILGGYHWDCSDWVRPNQNPLPNITEVPGSEVPDSSSFHSNDSNDDSAVEQRLLPPIDPARDLATLDEELYLTYRSEDDGVVPYGFPHCYPSQSDISTNLCDIEDSDVPT
ncbi:Laminin G domain [Nesidiocoris tenuis]|uniref:Laminin G domain n=1 Tax=Nesidiocoris tenuis TaxID=355587 RepID=A0ABN7AJL8_9HEMI|nr:Laminin G domain [Nesidiocoris tenuis]